MAEEKAPGEGDESFRQMSEQAMDEEDARYMNLMRKFLNPPSSSEIERTWNKPLPDTMTNIIFYPGDLKNRLSDKVEDTSEADLRSPLKLLIEEKLKSKLKEKYGDVPLEQLAEAHKQVTAGEDMEAYMKKKLILMT